MILLSGRSYERQTGGNTRYIRTVADGLIAQGCEIEFAAPKRKSSRSWAAFDALKMQRLARDKGASIAWFPVDTGPIHRGRGVSTVLTLQGVAALHEPDVRGRLAGPVWRARAAAAARVSDVIITGSQSSANDILQLSGSKVSERIVVIPHGISDDWFEPPPESTFDEVEQIADLETPFALYYGNIEPRKNLPIAVEAIELLRKDFPDLRLIVSGSPAWDSDDLVALLSSEPWIEYLGRRSDDEIRVLLARAQLFVFPSRYEGFGFPVLEAMAAGTPVACSRRGSLDEVVGDVAFTTNELTATAFAEACNQALSADRQLTAAKSIEHARKFSWAESIRRHREVFDSIG